MRTKTLLLTAALSAAGVASALGQVYSVNAVGYVNTPLTTGWNLVANPLNTGGNTVKEVHPTAPANAQLVTFSPASGYTTVTFDDLEGSWQPNGNGVIAPGTGYWLRVAAAGNVTYVGEVPQGNLSTPLVAGLNLVASQVPQAGGITSVLGYTPAPNDQVLVYDPASGYKTYTFDDLESVWVPSEPILKVGEGVWITRGTAGNWTRNFSVNP
jgi:hypothetical protein